jgi:plastocyanin
MKKVLIVILVVLVLAVGGWAVFGGGSSNNNSGYGNTNSTQSKSTASQPSSGAITIRNMMFTPSQITVAKGGTVTWTNNDTVAHTVTDDLSNVGGPASGNIEPGSTYSFRFNKTGSFQYHCSLHSSMRGTIVVK